MEGFAKKGDVFTWEKSGFEATAFRFTTDQLGTQLDPPAHWAPEYPAIDELPPTYAIRPLVVISIEEQVAKDPGYALQVADIEAWEKAHGTIPEGSVVFVRSGWSKDWPDPALSTRFPFPGVGLDALKFLHEERHILFHGHEPLDTDATPTLEGEYWLLHNGYTQAEGVANLDQVAETAASSRSATPRSPAGSGGLARYVAICPPDWPHGVSDLGGRRAAAEVGQAAALGRRGRDAGALSGSRRPYTGRGRLLRRVQPARGRVVEDRRRASARPRATGHALAAGVVLDLVALDLGDAEIVALGVGEVEARDRRAGPHGEALGQA